MKTRLAALVMLLLLEGSTIAVQSDTPGTAPTEVKQVRLSDSATALLKLTHGDVSEQVILAYIENARRNFEMGPDEVVYLKQQGVSDKVVSAALNHHVKVPQPTVTVPQQAAPPVAVAQQQQQQPTIVVAPPQTTYVQAPTQPVYVYSSPSYPYYDPYPYYYNYYPYRYSHYGYGYGFPAFSFNFGYGGFRGGHGGYHHSFNTGGAHHINFSSGGFHGGRHR